MKLSKFNSNSLYIMRIVAAQAVLLGHLFNFFKISPFVDQKYFPHIQSLAVIVFFVLSGFLTDMSAQNKPEDYTFSKYLKAHATRIYSFFLAALVFIAAVDSCIIAFGTYPHVTSYTLPIFIKNVLMFPHNFQAFGSGRPLWTLFVEWWLYISYGYFFFKCRRDSQRGTLHTMKIILGVIIFVIPLGAYMWQGGQFAMTVYAFALGIVCNRIYGKINRSKMGVPFIITLFAFVASCIYFRNAYHFTTVICMCLLFLEALVFGGDRQSCIGDRGQKALVFLSGTTYPLYLIHYTVIEFFLFVPIVQSKIWQFVLSVAVSNALAVLLYLALKPKKKKSPQSPFKKEIL